MLGAIALAMVVLAWRRTRSPIPFDETGLILIALAALVSIFGVVVGFKARHGLFRALAITGVLVSVASVIAWFFVKTPAIWIAI